MCFFSVLEPVCEDAFTTSALNVCFLNFLFLVDKCICNVCMFKKNVSSEHAVTVFYLEDTLTVKFQTRFELL